MLGALLATLLSAPPGAAKAVELAKAHQWEELYLAFASGKAADYPKKDRPKIARALAQGCQALQGDDATLAFSLGDRSVELEPTADGLTCAALCAKRIDQRGAAEDALTTGAKKFPKDARFPLELGRLYLEDGQEEEAARQLAKVPAKAKESAEARSLLLRIAKPAPTSNTPLPLASAQGTAQPTRELPAATSLSYESGVDSDGRRIRQNQYFRFRYFNARRDFGQRADYEGAVQAALENARLQTGRLLGETREKPLDVILYSAEEFRLHHGPQMARAVAGFYAEDAIRMNDSAEINEHNRAVLVHEYVHAVMDELDHFRHDALPVWLHEGTAEFIEWRSLDSEGPPAQLDRYLRQLALQGKVPSLTAMNGGPLAFGSNPAVTYAVSALAVRLLIERRSMRELVELMRDCGSGTPFDTALEQHFGTTVERLDEELQDGLKSR